MEQNISINCKVQEDVTYIDSRITVYLGNILADMKSVPSYLDDLRSAWFDHGNLEPYNVSLIRSCHDSRAAMYYINVACGGNMLGQLMTSRLEY